MLHHSPSNEMPWSPGLGSWLGGVISDGAGEFHPGGDARRGRQPVAMERQEIRNPDDLFTRDDPAARAGADEQAAVTDFRVLDGELS